MHTVWWFKDTWRQRPWIRSTISSLNWPHTSQNIKKLRDATTCSHSVLCGLPAYEHFFGIIVWELLFLTTYSIIHVHRWVTYSQDGKSTVATGHIAANESCSWEVCRLHQATLTGRSACEGKVLICHCGLRTHTLLSHPDVVELNLRLHLIKFVPSFILFTFVSVHRMIQFYFMYFFCVAQHYLLP